jgi:hypothetical protein
MENDDLPKDLTFTDPAVSTRPLNLPVSRGPKKDEVSTPMGKLRDFVIGLLLLVGFFAAMWGLSLLITGARGK